MNTETYLALYSKSQNAFHVDTLTDFCRDNITHLKNGHASDYLPLYSSKSKVEVREFLKIAMESRNQKKGVFASENFEQQLANV